MRKHGLDEAEVFDAVGRKGPHNNLHAVRDDWSVYQKRGTRKEEGRNGGSREEARKEMFISRFLSIFPKNDFLENPEIRKSKQKTNISKYTR